MTVVATSGHVDHGKSAVVLALTGTDPDRLAEEKARGLTIDLGFASTSLPSGAVVAFVDVPGHVLFVRNMLAGVGAVSACLFVVAAPEGWKPQSEEHLRILELVGVRHGVVVITKVDLVDTDRLAAVHDEVSASVTGTFLADAEAVDVDARHGSGLDDLRAALDRLVASVDAAPDLGRPRLWIDRAFVATGSGTVVTGTLAGGSLHVGDALAVAPAGVAVRVRGIESLHVARDEVGPGNRVALNLTGVATSDVHRGDVLVRDDQWHRTTTVDASLSVLAGLDHPVSRRGAYLAHLGAAELPVRMRLLGADEAAPGTTVAVRLHLPDALPLVPGDRYVLRDAGRQQTIGGGEVLDVDPILPASRARPDRSIERVVRERGWVDVARLERLVDERVPPTIGRWVVSPEALDAGRRDLQDRLDAAGPLGLDVAALDERARAVLATLDGVDVHDGRAARVDDEDALGSHPYITELESNPFTPPAPDGVDRGELRELVRRGVVVKAADDVYFAPAAVEAAAATVAGLLAERPEGVTVGEVREALGTSRKYAVPLLAHLDATGRTRRRGDMRIAGPRLPT